MVANKAQELGSPEVIVIRADVSKDEECKQFVNETVNHFGRCKCTMSFYFELNLLHINCFTQFYIYHQKQLKLWPKVMIFNY